MVQFSDNFILQLNYGIPFIGNNLSETRFYWSPEKFTTSINISEHNQLVNKELEFLSKLFV